MNNINITLNKKSKIYGTNDELFQGLKAQAQNTKPFLDSISKFLEEFNNKYGSNISFEQVLNIYNDENKLDKNQSIILCKALLDFIQNNGIEVKFKNKSYLLRYNTLASTNAVLEYNPLSEKEKQSLETLSITISSFIKKVRNYFRMIIQDSIPLDKANVDNYFEEVPGIKQDNEITPTNNETDPNSEITNGSINISNGLVINLNATDEQLKNRIINLSNKHLIDLLNYVYERINTDKTGKKHIDLAKFIFDKNYENYLGQLVLNVFEHQKKVRKVTIDKINITKLKECLLNNPTKKANNQNEDINITGKKLILNPGIEIDLESDKQFINDLSNLSGSDVQLLFSYLENVMRNDYGILPESTGVELAIKIQKSDDRKLNIYQKIYSLRKKSSIITERFLNNNINITGLRELILSTIKKEEGEKGTNLPENKNESFDFTIIDEETKKEINIKIELNGKKDKEGFIYSLNNLIIQECERIGLEGCIEEFIPDNFEGVELNSSFFNNVGKKVNDKNILDMFEIIEQEILEKFLQLWHKKVMGTPLKEGKINQIETGSKEEFLDFVQIWQKELYKIIRKQGRKGRRTNNNLGDRRKVAVITEEMFDGIDKLTPDMISKLSKFKFQKVFSIISSKKVEEMLIDYLEKGKNIK